MSSAPIEVVWDGKAFTPSSPYWVRKAEGQFAAGEIVHMVQHEPRSMASHGHYFAAVEAAFQNMPDAIKERFPTADHLRKHALIKTGWFNSTEIAVGSNAAALRVAAYIQAQDEYALAVVHGSVVTAFTAKTQSFKMGNKDFQKSKDDVLGFLSDLLGVKPAELAQAGKAA